MKLQRLRIGSQAYAECPSLEEPLSDALAGLQSTMADLTDGLVRMRLFEPRVVTVASNTPGTPPWPIRLGQIVSAPKEVRLLNTENLTTQGAAGVPTSGVGVTAWRCEGQTLFVDFVSGLTLNSQYRLWFGVLDAV